MYIGESQRETGCVVLITKEFRYEWLRECRVPGFLSSRPNLLPPRPPLTGEEAANLDKPFSLLEGSSTAYVMLRCSVEEDNYQYGAAV